MASSLFSQFLTSIPGVFLTLLTSHAHHTWVSPFLSWMFQALLWRYLMEQSSEIAETNMLSSQYMQEQKEMCRLSRPQGLAQSGAPTRGPGVLWPITIVHTTLAGDSQYHHIISSVGENKGKQLAYGHTALNQRTMVRSRPSCCRLRMLNQLCTASKPKRIHGN